MLGPLGKALLFAEWELVRCLTPELLGALLAYPLTPETGLRSKTKEVDMR